MYHQQRHHASSSQLSSSSSIGSPMNHKDLEAELDEYLSEYKLQAPIEPISHYAGEFCEWYPVVRTFFVQYWEFEGFQQSFTNSTIYSVEKWLFLLMHLVTIHIKYYYTNLFAGGYVTHDQYDKDIFRFSCYEISIFKFPHFNTPEGTDHSKMRPLRLKILCSLSKTTKYETQICC